MSHAMIIVAIDGSVMQNDLQEAVGAQMAPFDEAEECFKRGSRWDWWVIGGRYSGRLLGHDYLRRSEVDETGCAEHSRNRAIESWKSLEKESRPDDPFIREYCYGVRNVETQPMSSMPSPRRNCHPEGVNE